jgi:membrane protease YdiL (CAAX protease family)
MEHPNPMTRTEGLEPAQEVPRGERSAPSVWSSVLALIVGPLAAGLAVEFVLILVSAPGSGAPDRGFWVHATEWLQRNAGTLPGLLVLILPGQAVFLAIAIVLAAGSEGGVRSRLGLTASRASGSALALAVAGTLGIQWAISFAFDLTRIEPSAHLKEMWRIMCAPTGIAAVIAAALLGVVPAVCEETLYRGLGQRVLVARWSAPVGIAVVSVLFAAAHMDVQHAIVVLPIGLWLGFVAWRTGSTRASMACHAANNLSAFVVGRLWGDPESGSLPATWPFTLAGILLCACAVIAIRAMGRTAPEPEVSMAELEPNR